MRRLFKEGLFTTIIGLIILMYSSLVIWYGKSTPYEMSGWVAIGILFLRSKDSLINLGKE
jgi:hypothetical protein